MELVDKITAFAQDPKVIQEHLALLVVGRDKGDSAEEIMKRVLVSALLRFHKIPIKPGQS